MVGTGRMGTAMAGRLAGAGHALTVANRTRARADEVARATGGQVAPTPREAAAAEVVVVSLADDAAVRSTYLRDDGLLAGLRPGTVVCDTSTVHPDTVRDLAPHVEERGATLLDCPVSGSVSVAEAGALTVMAGGPPAALEWARPALDAFAGEIFHLGPVGTGATMKLVVNSLVHSLNLAVAESLVLAERAGLDPETAYDVLEAGATGAPFVTYKRGAFLDPDSAPVAFTLELVAKDQRLIHRLAQEVGAQMPLADTSRDVVARALAAGLGQRDMSAVADLLR